MSQNIEEQLKRMDNPETQVTFGTRHRTKKKKKNKKNKNKKKPQYRKLPT
jgi:hypothetical protein